MKIWFRSGILLMIGTFIGLLLWQISSTVDGHVNPTVSTVGRTLSCADLSLQSSSHVFTSSSLVSFLDSCGNATDLIVLGTDNIDVGKKCCAVSSLSVGGGGSLLLLANFSEILTMMNLTAIPQISLVPLVDSIPRDARYYGWLKNCPRLNGAVVPLGFYMSLFGSLLGTALSLLLNGLEWMWVRVRHLQHSAELSPMEHMLKPHSLLYVKTFLCVVAGTVIAVTDALTLPSSSSSSGIFFSQYSVYCGVVAHGAVTKSLCDYFSALAAWITVSLALSQKNRRDSSQPANPSNNERDHNSTSAHIVVPREPPASVSANVVEIRMKKLPERIWKAIMATPLPPQRDPFEVPSTCSFFFPGDTISLVGFVLLLLPFAPVLVTHIFPGVAFYFLPIAIAAGACAVFVGLFKLVISKCAVTLVPAVFLGSFVAAIFNFFMHLVVRMAFSYMALTYGGNELLFPYRGPSSSGWGSLWVERAYFFFEMSTNSCYALYAVESFQRSVELVIVVL